MNSSYRVIYPKGDRSKLSVAEVYDYEESDWANASRLKYTDENDAWLQADYLAKQFNKELIGDSRNLPDYLD